MSSTKDAQFWESYNTIKNTRMFIEGLGKKAGDIIFTEKDITDLKKILYTSFNNIKKGDYSNVYYMLKQLPEYLSSLRKTIHSTLNAYLKAYHLTIPTYILENDDIIQDKENTKKALELLIESFYCGKEKRKRCGAGGGMN